MNKNSRTKNSTLNLIVNFLYQFVILFLAFFTRRVFIQNLGVDYLGISGLFTNILELFSLAELGIGASISFSMYRYLKEKNEKKLQQLNSYYRTLYNRIAVIVLIIGLLLVPFLKYIIKLENDIPNVELYYIICLLNSVFSYLFVYKTTIVSADQSEYRLKIINIGIEVLKVVFQLISIIVFRSYLTYLIVQILFTFIGNFIKSKYAEKWYPFIKEKAELPKEEKKDLWNNIQSMFYYKIGNSIMNHTDDILTSTIINTTLVGIYSNYTMIYLKISSIINLIFSSMIASIGNLNVDATPERKYLVYKILRFIAYFLFSIASIGIWFVAEDVIIALCGSSKYILSKDILFITVINYYLMGVLHPNTIFRQTTGLFKLAKYSMLICCILNIFFSIILGKIFGLFGIILGSIISRLLTNIWYEPYILYKKFFDKNPIEYYMSEIRKIILLVCIALVLSPIMKLISLSHLYLRIIIKGMICLVVTVMVLCIVYWKSNEFKYVLDKVKSLKKSILEKKRNKFL